MLVQLWIQHAFFLNVLMEDVSTLKGFRLKWRRTSDVDAVDSSEIDLDDSIAVQNHVPAFQTGVLDEQCQHVSDGAPPTPDPLNLWGNLDSAELSDYDGFSVYEPSVAQSGHESVQVDVGGRSTLMTALEFLTFTFVVLDWQGSPCHGKHR